VVGIISYRCDAECFRHFSGAERSAAERSGANKLLKLEFFMALESLLLAVAMTQTDAFLRARKEKELHININMWRPEFARQGDSAFLGFQRRNGFEFLESSLFVLNVNHASHRSQNS
jgi:hypothetical protein